MQTASSGTLSIRLLEEQGVWLRVRVCACVRLASGLCITLFFHDHPSLCAIVGLATTVCGVPTDASCHDARIGCILTQMNDVDRVLSSLKCRIGLDALCGKCALTSELYTLLKTGGKLTQQPTSPRSNSRRCTVDVPLS